MAHRLIQHEGKDGEQLVGSDMVQPPLTETNQDVLRRSYNDGVLLGGSGPGSRSMASAGFGFFCLVLN